MPIGERFCLSFSLLRLTQKMEFSRSTIGLLFSSKMLFEPLAAETNSFQNFLIRWLLFLQHSSLSWGSQLALLFHLPHSILCKSPLWAIRTAIYAGFLLFHAQQAAQSFHRTHSCGCLAGGGNLPPKVSACKGCQWEHQGWHFIIKEECMACV